MIIRMTEGPGELYRLMAWLSPAYPVGAFSYSSGIEWAVESGDIAHAWNTSWGVSTRMIGGLVMVHGDERAEAALQPGRVDSELHLHTSP